MKNTLETLEARRLMATFAVTNAADTGTGSLRWAIQQANLTDAADTVVFSIGSGAATITIGSSLDITKPITIDGATQPGYAGAPLIRITNSGTASGGLYVNAPGSVIRGLSVTNMGTAANPNDGPGISLVKQNIVVENCYLGLTPTGAAAGNERDGVALGVDADGAIIRNNVIGSNGDDGVQIYTDNVTITGNIIGLNPAGSALRANGGHGVHNMGFVNVIVGGDTASLGNVISGNAGAGVYFANLNAKGGIYNNFIGVSKSGNAKFANGTWGVHLVATNDVQVGGPGKGNRIGGKGITLTGNGRNNVIRENQIGFGVNPAFDVGDSTGIELNSGFDNDVSNNVVGRVSTGIRVVGGDNFVESNYVGVLRDNTTAVPCVDGIVVAGDWNELRTNVVANNSSAGVWLQSGDDNSVNHNFIWNNYSSILRATNANTGMGAAKPLEIVEVTQNATTGIWSVDTFMDVPNGERYTIAYYVSDKPGLPLSGEMQHWLTSRTIVGGPAYEPVTTTFAASLLPDGKYITATLTRAYLVNGVTQYGTTHEPTAATEIVGRPSVYSSSFEYATGHAWSFQFSEDVSASLSAADLNIIRDDGAKFAATGVTWNAATKTARFTRSTPLPDGKYTAGIKVFSVSNSAGANFETGSLPFTALRGDANGDGRVNFDDLLLIAANYNSIGKTFSQGDFNYDNKVNFDDLLILASNYNKVL